ncbi:MAG TPA: ROK family protein [Vicinamibacteria bacterium]|nr:ROK family protein [Vicinamibacteria bacterium]
MKALAIDLGGTKAAFAVVDAEGRILARTKRPSHDGDAALSFEALARTAGETVEAAGLRWSELEGAGVIVPGIYDAATGRAWAPNLWGDAQVGLLEALAPLLPLRLTIDSDRSGYVLGESWLGAARGCTDAVFLGVGTGIGAGLLCGGRVIRGAAGIAGAVGWFATDPAWTPQGTLGCWEAQAAAPALARRTGARDGKEVTDAARKGDASARRAVEEAAAALAMGIADLISALNPQVVVLGGGLMLANDLFLEPIRRAVPRWAQPIAARQCRIVPSALGQDAGLLGAARLALFEGARS